jgi:hypothetical protein
MYLCMQVEGDSADREQQIESVLQKVIACSSPGNLMPSIAHIASNGPMHVQHWAFCSLARLVCSIGRAAAEYMAPLPSILQQIAQDGINNAVGGTLCP